MRDAHVYNDDEACSAILAVRPYVLKQSEW